MLVPAPGQVTSVLCRQNSYGRSRTHLRVLAREPSVHPDSSLSPHDTWVIHTQWLTDVPQLCIQQSCIFKQILLPVPRSLCAHGVVPQKFPLGDPRRPLSRFRRLLALHRQVAQGVGAPSEALAGWQRGGLFCGVALRVTGQVLQGAEEPEGALRCLSVTHRWLLAAEGQQVRCIPGISSQGQENILMHKHIWS